MLSGLSSSSRLSNILLHAYVSFFSHSSVDGHLGFFCFLDTVKNAAMNRRILSGIFLNEIFQTVKDEQGFCWSCSILLLRQRRAFPGEGKWDDRVAWGSMARSMSAGGSHWASTGEGSSQR